MRPTLKTSHAERIFSVTSDSSSSARSALAASWTRSMQRYGLDPRHSKPPFCLGASELARAHENIGGLVRAAQGTLDALFTAVGGTGCCVLFSDRNGVTLDRRTSAAEDDMFHRWGLWPGTVWSEELEGTNGIGTCIAEERALTIHREQHFFTRNTALSCSGAPVYDHEGKLVAALDVSSCRSDVTDMFTGLIALAVSDAARRIEILNFRQSFQGARFILAPDVDRHAGALLAVDRDDLIVGATRAARLAYGLTTARMSRPLPADMILGATGEKGGELRSAERGVLQRSLASTAGNVSAAAKALGISRTTLHRKMKRLGMHAPN